MLHLARYYAYEGAILILGPRNSDPPPEAELMGVGVLDATGVRLAAEILSAKGTRPTRTSPAGGLLASTVPAEPEGVPGVAEREQQRRRK